MIIDRKVKEFLNSQLDLPSTGKEQDWAIEMSNPDRVSDFLIFFHTANLNDEQKYGLVSLILSSYDEFLYKHKHSIELWDKITLILISNKSLYKDLLSYWALPDENNPALWFNITQYIRRIV